MESAEHPEATRPPQSHRLDSTAFLLGRAREGDPIARNQLVARHLPALRRWAHGRLPGQARGLMDTDDLVQVTLIRALGHLEDFEHRRAGAFFAYLRRILLNQIRDEVRRAGRRPGHDALDIALEDGRPSPLDQVIGRQSLSKYEEALKRLAPEQQEAIILRLELGFTYPELADALERPTANAARLMVSRAVLRLAREMRGRR